MTRLSLTVVSLAAGLAVAGPPRLPAPPVDDRDGVKVARITYGKHHPTVTVGPLEFTLEPLALDTAGRPSLALLVKNASNAEIDTTDRIPNVHGSATALRDDTGRPYRSNNGKEVTPGQILGPGRTIRVEVQLSPEVNRAAKVLTAEVDAPPGSGADRWALAFPRVGWVGRRPYVR